VARGGIEAAIGKIQSALPSGNVADVLSAPLEYESPLYQFDREPPEKFSPATERRWVTKVTVTDESGKVNLNCAPTRVLQAILGVDGDTARKIRSSLPLPEAAAAAGQSWLTSMDDLVTRGLMSPAAYEAVPKHLVTVYTVADPARPVEFLNVNAAPPRVLAAILDVTFEAAQQAAQKKPFNSLADLSAAAGKDPMTFNIKPASDAPGALPRELSLRSRCFRIESQAELMFRRADGSEESTLRSRAEAVVVFGEGGAVQITYSSEAPQRDGAGKA
jgi:type II secretory pathway component PulK